MRKIPNLHRFTSSHIETAQTIVHSTHMYVHINMMCAQLVCVRSACSQIEKKHARGRKCCKCSQREMCAHAHRRDGLTHLCLFPNRKHAYVLSQTCRTFT